MSGVWKDTCEDWKMVRMVKFYVLFTIRKKERNLWGETFRSRSWPKILSRKEMLRVGVKGVNPWLCTNVITHWFGHKNNFQKASLTDRYMWGRMQNWYKEAKCKRQQQKKANIKCTHQANQRETAISCQAPGLCQSWPEQHRMSPVNILEWETPECAKRHCG